MVTDRVVLTSLVALAVGACFDPTFHSPVCGPGGACPDGWQCTAGEGNACVSDGTSPEPGAPDAKPPSPGEPDAMLPPMPCEKTWQSLLTNGNFDAGQSEWTQDPANIQVIYQFGDGLPVTPDSGMWAALLGGHDNRRQVFTQAVTLPPGTERVRFRGSRCLATSETPDRDYDKFTISLVQANDDTKEIAPFFAWDNRNGAATCNWTPADSGEKTVANLATAAAFRIFSLTDNGRVSTLYLDTLVLEAFACRPASVDAEVPER
jgi:hypothetical protein